MRTEDRRQAAKKKPSDFAVRFWSEWKRLSLPVTDATIVAAVSGGADSMAMLLALDELLKAERLGLKVIVAHLNHGLRAEAGAEDASFVEEAARDLGLEIEAGRADVRSRARQSVDNLEQAARRARYQFLSEVAWKTSARIILTAHTINDQAETVLLRLMRGGGAEGLGGIEPVRIFDDNKGLLLVRPMLTWARRAETEEYCRARGVEARVDEMNLDERFARVRVRRHLIPLMQTFNGRIVETLARTASLLRDDAATLQAAARELLAKATERVASGAPSLRVDILASASAALRRRALRLWIEEARGDLRRLEMVHLLAVEKLLVGERGGRTIVLPGGARIYRKRGRLYFSSKRVEKGSGGD